MSPSKLFFILLIALFCCSMVLGQRGGGRGRGRGNGMRYGGRGGGSMGGRGRRYRSTLYNDDEVYGYEASYPGGDAMYVNYRNSEARAKRGQEFARSNPYSSSSGGLGAGTGQMGYQDQGGRDEREVDSNPMW